MKQLFRFDVTLGELMNLYGRAKEVSKLGAVFSLLKMFWYNLKDKQENKERWNRIRVGSINVYLDDEDHLHLDFITRFHLGNSQPFLNALDLIAESDWDQEYPAELKDFEPYN